MMGHGWVRPPLPPATVVYRGLCVGLVSGVLWHSFRWPLGWGRALGSASAWGSPACLPCLGDGASGVLLPLPSTGCAPAQAPSPLLHIPGQPLQGKEEPRANGQGPGVTRAQAREGRKRETWPGHHTQAHFYRWALCLQGVWAVWSPPGHSPWKRTDRSRAPWGRPDSRARRVDGGCVQHGARLLKSRNYTHLGVMPLSQVICMVG